jgi:membrane-bound metal-dependent hydrolase YbcI (DUF457 family)
MLGRTHFAASIFLAVLFFSFYSFDNITNVFLLIVFVFGSLFPDIDSSKSIIGRKVKLVSYLFKHRGFFHSIFAMLLFGLLFYFLFSPSVGFAFVTGFLLHLMMDAISKEGLVFFGTRIKGPIKVGSMTEHIIYLVLLVVSLFLIVV